MKKFLSIVSYIYKEVNKDVLVVNVGVNDTEVSNVKSLAIFWKFDASNPAVPTFLTYIYP